jgi:hypothetical protein
MIKSVRLVLGTLAVLAFVNAAHAQTTAIGTWDLTTVSPISETKSVLEIRKEGDKLVAVGKSAQGERPYDKVAVEGANITLVVTISYEGSPMVITYSGKIDGAKIEGSADFGGLATGTFSATAAK